MKDLARLVVDCVNRHEHFKEEARQHQQGPSFRLARRLSDDYLDLARKLSDIYEDLRLMAHERKRYNRLTA